MILVSKFGCSYYCPGVTHRKLGLEEEILTCISLYTFGSRRCKECRFNYELTYD